ncbi:hypothetical protein OYC64_016162 [Pagothenia borchgrevinki]|uniref:L1 transposable element RRM domain-containing protein n=1 Tax=Pagothenia borchgrevinki TaxID=8213 RepID=A0ABD2HJM4_PAGBO
MSKSQGSRGKSQQQTKLFSSQDKEANKMATSASEASEQPLTLAMLVGELEKLRQDVTGEFTASMNTALAPIQASLQKITDTVATHTATITGMETALSAHSEVAVLKSKLETTDQVNDRLQLAVEDLVSRSKRQNLRVIGIPEGMEGDDARLFMTTLFKKMVGDPQLDTLELDRAHRSLAPKPPQGSRPLIVRFHKYAQKERVLLWARKSRDVSYQGHPIRISEDFSATLAKKRAAFNKVKSQLYKEGIRFGLLYPARLRVTINGQTRIFYSVEEAERFYQVHSSK